MTEKINHLGKAGHLACMSELLALGYNVAIPEVDVGDDVFVVDDQNGTLWRVQVKTSEGRKERDGRLSTQYLLNRAQVMTQKRVDITYVFALRRHRRWDFVVLSRADLESKRLTFESTQTKAAQEKYFNLKLMFENNLTDVRCWGVSFLAHLNNFEAYFPPLSQVPGAKVNIPKTK